MNRYLCMHLHFYQPPRENPWLDEIEYQESAYPFHDWNERIDMECYRANGASRILDGQGRVVDLANNYAKVSFNFGPTLLSWLEKKDPITYERILEGDRLSMADFGGHGNAIAQCYNHTIMPLSNARDKETQVLWGLYDFEKRFKRVPEGMWLPEAAVDTESLEVLSANGLKFVILAPRQARAIRPLNAGDPKWTELGFEKVDPREPYLINLPSGRSIAAFFYDGPVSKAVAFEGLLHNGETFARRLLGGFDERSGNQLLHIATDGETYGHHHKRGDMALAYAIHHLEQNNLAKITNYGQYLELNPPTKEAQIHEDSSWSCEHGIERWRSNCGCNSGMKPGWHQKWRAPLRAALDKVRDQLREPFESKLKEFMEDPWAARNDYIRVIENRSLANIDEQIKKWCGRSGLRDIETSTILKGLEAQRQLMLMYTSCAWFFDEISGIETIQNLQYAYRAIELSERAFGINVLQGFIKDLELAESNIPEIANGRIAFERFVLPARIDNIRVGSHFAVASIFENFGVQNEVYNHKITVLEFKRFTSGKARVAFGQARIRSRVTLDRSHIIFGVMHFGDHNITAGIKKFETEEEYERLAAESKAAFDQADLPATLRVLDSFFGLSTYSLKDLFRDEQKKLLDIIIGEAMVEADERLQRLYRNHYSLLTFLSNTHIPSPKVFSDIAEFVQNRGLRRALAIGTHTNTAEVRSYIDEAKRWNIPLDGPLASHEFEALLHAKMLEFESDDGNFNKLLEILRLVKLADDMPTPVQLGPVQNWFWLWYQTHSAPERPNEEQRELENVAQQLAERLKILLPSKERMKDDDRSTELSRHVPPSAPQIVSV